MELIRELPRDYRVVWKAAVCSEIDDKGGLVRMLNEDMFECERNWTQMREHCREWRVNAKNPLLDFTVPKDAQGSIAEQEAFAHVIAQSRGWARSAVGYGFADQEQILHKLSNAQHVDADDALDSSALNKVTNALSAKLAPFVEEGKACIAARQDKRRVQLQPPSAVALDPSAGKSVSMTPTQESLHNNSHKSHTHSVMKHEWRGAVGAGSGSSGLREVSAASAKTFSLSMSTSQIATPHQLKRASVLSGADLNYDAMHEQLNLAQQLRAQLEDGFDAIDISSIANTSIDVEMRQLVTSRMHQVVRDVKESLAHSQIHSSSTIMPSSSSPANKRQSDSVGAGSAKEQSAHHTSRSGVRDRAKAAKAGEESRGNEVLVPAQKEGPKSLRPKTVWQKLDERDKARSVLSGPRGLASKSSMPDGEAATRHAAVPRHVPVHQGLVRRTTKAPPDRIVPSCGAPRGFNTVTRHDGQAHTHRSLHVLLDTRVGRDRAHIIPTGSFALLQRPSFPEEHLDHASEGARRQLLPPESPAAKALSDLQKASLGTMLVCGVMFELTLPMAGSWTVLSEANMVRELGRVLQVPTRDIALDGRPSDLVPHLIEVQLRHCKQWDSDIVERVREQAQDPTSFLWALPQLAKITVQGMVFEKAEMHGSPPREDAFEEAQTQGASPQLTSQVWEAVKAPMMREHVQDVNVDNEPIDAIQGTHDQDSTKDLPVGIVTTSASSRRSLDFHEIAGQGSLLPLAIKHRKAELPQRVTEAGPLAHDEESVTEHVLSYLSHHILAHIETDAKFQRGATWRDNDDVQDLMHMRRPVHMAGACSPFVAGLLGSEGLMMMVQAGIDVDDEQVLEVAEGSIMEEARRIFRKEKAGECSEAADAAQHKDSLSLLAQPGRGRRPTVLRESTQPFTTRRTDRDDEVPEKFILEMLLNFMTGGEDDDAALQAALDDETSKQSASRREGAERLAALSESQKWHLDDARQSDSVSSLLSQDGEHMSGELVVGHDVAGVALHSSTAMSACGDVVGVEGGSTGGVQAVEQPRMLAFDNHRAEQHQQRVEDTLQRIANSMDALTNFTLQIAAHAPAPPYDPPQPVGAVQVQGGGRRSGARSGDDGPHNSDPPSAYSLSESIASTSMGGSPAEGGGEGEVRQSEAEVRRSEREVRQSGSRQSPSDQSPYSSSAIVESDYTPPKSSPEGDEHWTPVEGRGMTDQDVQTCIDLDVQAAMCNATCAPSPAPGPLQLVTHSAQTSTDFGASSMDLDSAFPDVRTRRHCNVEASGVEPSTLDLRTSIDFEDVASGRRLPSHPSTPSSPSKKRQGVASRRGGGSSSELPEPLTLSLISTLRCVAEEVALLREARLLPVHPPPHAAVQQAPEAGRAMALEDWIRAGAPLVDVGVQVWSCTLLVCVVCAWTLDVCACTVLCSCALCFVSFQTHLAAPPSAPVLVVLGVSCSRLVYVMFSSVSFLQYVAWFLSLLLVCTNTQAQQAHTEDSSAGQTETERLTAVAAGVSGDKTHTTGTSPDASTSLSEGEWREPASLLALDTSFTTAPGSPPPFVAHNHSQYPFSRADTAAQTRFPLTFSGVVGSSREHHPWREGGPAFEETLEETLRATRASTLPRPGGHAERRAERRERRAQRLRDSRQTRDRSDDMQSTATLMTMMSNPDVTAETHTESDLSDGEVAASVVWWVGEGKAQHEDAQHDSMSHHHRIKGGSDESDGEIRRAT